MAEDFASRFSQAPVDFAARFQAAPVVSESKVPEKKEPSKIGQSVGGANPLDVILNPQGIPQHLLSLAATAALTGGAGSLGRQAAVKLGLPELAVKAAPAIGRVIASGGMGMAEAVDRGDPNVTRSGVLDSLVAGATEALMGVAGKPTKAVAKAIAENDTAKRAYQWALEQPAKAIQAIAPRVGQFEFLNVPSLSPTPLHLTEIAEKVKGLRGADYEEARKEIISELNRLSGTGARKDMGPAGEAFAGRTSERLFEPEPLKKTGRQRITGNTGRAVADALTTQPGPGGFPVGLIGGAFAPEYLGDYARRALQAVIPR